MQQRLLIAAIVLVILLVNISCAGPEASETPSAPSYTGQPSLTLPPEIEKGLLILSHSTYVDKYGYFHLIGEVENLSKYGTEHNKVRAEFYDEQGALYTTGTGECYRELIGPGGKSPFEIIFPKTPEVTNYKLTAERD